MRLKFKSIISGISAFAMLIAAVGAPVGQGSTLLNDTAITASAASTVSFEFNAPYQQSSARTMTAMINSFRKSSNAWYWNSDDSTKTTCSGLSDLTFDYELEKVAMQRAAELVFNYSHTRPDGTSCFTANTVSGSRGENICIGTTNLDAEAAFELWREDNENYAGQGHRRNMLSSTYKYIGIAHIYYNGCHYWVQELCSNSGSTTATTAVDTQKKVSVNVTASDVTATSVALASTSASIDVNEKAALPSANVTVKQIASNVSWAPAAKATTTPTWSVSSGSSYVTLSGTSVTGKAVGSALLTASCLGTTSKYTVKVAHTYDSGKVTKAATCTATGVRTYTCTGGCGATKTETIAALGHNYSTSSITKAATCTETGVRTYKCANCGATKTETIAALGHNYSTSSVTKAATCTETGVRTYKCANCGATKTETIAALGHNYSTSSVTKAATCTAAGVRTYKCANCGATKTETIAALGHSYSTAWTTDKAATCTTVGSKSHHCTRCDAKTDVTEIPVTAHSYVNKVVAATPTAKGYTQHTCSVCGYSYKDSYTEYDSSSSTPAHKHSYTKKTTKAATCTANGVVTYTCSCGESYTETIKAKGHSYTVKVVAPTTSAKGYTLHTCKVCGSSYKDNYTAKLTRTSIAKASVSISGKKYAYTGKALKPAMTVKVGGKVLKAGTDYSVSYKNNKNTGKATVTITGKGNYTGKRSVNFIIKPKAEKLGTVISPKSKQIKLRWTKDKQATGYQITIALNKKFTSGKKSYNITKNTTVTKTITNLKKGKTYYVKVRAYKTINKSKFYGEYSKVKTVKCK